MQQPQQLDTGALIAAIAADAAPVRSQDRRVALAVAAAALAAALVFMFGIHARPDVMAASKTMRFDFKFVFAFALAASSYFTLRRAMRPELGTKPLGALLLIAPAMLAIAIALELIVMPSSTWVARLIGHNSEVCLTLIPAISLAPLAILLAVLSQGATTAPRLTGAVAGLLAGGIGAFFYAAHCSDDSPLFVATWYSIAIAAVTALGALAGPRLLRW